MKDFKVIIAIEILFCLIWVTNCGFFWYIVRLILQLLQLLYALVFLEEERDFDTLVTGPEKSRVFSLWDFPRPVTKVLGIPLMISRQASTVLSSREKLTHW